MYMEQINIGSLVEYSTGVQGDLWELEFNAKLGVVVDITIQNLKSPYLTKPHNFKYENYYVLINGKVICVAKSSLIKHSL